MKKQSSTAPTPESTGPWRRRDDLLELPSESRFPRWTRPGLSARNERLLEIVGTAVIFAFAVAWIWSINRVANADAQEPRAAITRTGAAVRAALTNRDAPSTAYLTDAAIEGLTEEILTSERGASGKLRAKIQASPEGIALDTLPHGVSVKYERGGEVVSTPQGSGVWRVLLAVGNGMRPVEGFNVINMLPFSAKQKGRIGLYYIGNWPSERGRVGPSKAPGSAYANPAGFIEVTKDNADTYVTEHFKLRDFLTHDQPNVWPKYLVLQPKLLDKLELVLNDLKSRGIDVSGAKIMSGFRTPQYNVGGGNTGGRANLSRHMYGDASDVYIDSDHDGQMDDLNRDGRITIDDSRVIAQAVDRVEAAHPHLIGGAGVYTAAAGHGPFIHIDTRGYRARWTGTSGG